MKKIIIAEKPSLARSVVAALYDDSPTLINNSYFEGNTYIITTVFGHLFEAYNIEDYRNVKEEWNLDILPFYPREFKFHLKRNSKTGKTDPSIQKQFEIIKGLIERKDVDEIINCGDADREGEVLIRLVIKNIAASAGKKQTRLWSDDTTPDTLRLAIASRKDASEYNVLANEGFARLYEDWLYGINLSRYVTIKSQEGIDSHFLFRVGRVLIAIVNTIYLREKEIAEFVSVPYYAVISKATTLGYELLLRSKKEYNEDALDDAKSLCHTYNSIGATVIDSIREKKILKAPRLYNTTSLQNMANRLYDMSPSKALETLQSLYEKGFITYPRVSSEFISEAEIVRIRQIIQKYNDLTGDNAIIFKDSKTIFNDAYVVSHGAITPTNKIPTKFDSKDEENIYEIIKNRFYAVFCTEPCQVDHTALKIKCADEIFAITGNVTITEGWKKYEPVKDVDKTLPQLKLGDTVNVNFEPVYEKTKPPAHYTVTTLNNFLEAPFKDETIQGKENNDQELLMILDGLQIGTGATRAPIIQKAILNKYILLDKKKYYITDIGAYLIETLDSLNIDLAKEKTLELNKLIKKVYRGELTIEEVLEITKKELDEIFAHKEAEVASFEGFVEENTPITFCPFCDGHIVSKNNLYGCDKYQENGCNFAISKRLFRGTITPEAVKDLIEKGKTEKPISFSYKEGKGKYKAYLYMRINAETKKLEYKLEKIKPKELKTPCPICGGTIIEKNGFYGCSNYDTTGCKYTIPKKIFGGTITATAADELLKSGRSSPLYFKSQNKKKFRAYLIMEFNKESDKYIFRTEFAEPEKLNCKCPKCKTGDLIVHEKMFGCSNYKSGCNFIIWKNTPFGKSITSNMAEKMVCNGHSDLVKNLKSKTKGTTYDAYFVLKNDYTIGLEFPTHQNKRSN